MDRQTDGAAPHWRPRSYTAFRTRLDEAGAAREVRESLLRAEIDALLGRIAESEPTLHALLPDESEEQRRARMYDEVRELVSRWPDRASAPPLFGAVVGVKDLFHVHGFPTRAGSRLPAEAFLEPGCPGRPGVADPPHPAPRADEASSVAALRDAGAIILGKTVSTEFAYFAPGPTRNPWNPNHTPGGSSSGSAAAVAAGMCHLALGTQTIGSISRPAAFCGVSGYKPSYGIVPRDGVVPFSTDADHVGPIAADADTLMVAAGVLCGSADGRDREPRPIPHAPPPPEQQGLLREGGPLLVPDDAYLAQCDSAGRAALDAMIERCRALGLEVERVSVMDDIAEINRLHQAMIARDFAEVHEFWFGRYGDLYHERSRDLIARGREVSDGLRDEARAGRAALRSRLEATLSRHGARIWLAPATVGEAPEGIAATGDPVINLPWTFAGLPTVALPVHAIPGGRGPHGLPLGVQLAAAHGSDRYLLQWASMIEARLSAG